MSARREADTLLLGWRVSLALNAENEDPGANNRAKTLMAPRQYATIRARAMQATQNKVSVK